MNAPHHESQPMFGRRRSNALPVVLLFLGCVVLAGCHLDGYTRSYYLAGVDQFGQRVEVGATFTPPQARAMAVRLERDGVFAPGVQVVETGDELERAAGQLEILTEDGVGQAGSLTTAVGQDAQPPWRTPALDGPMTYLSRKEGGRYRLQLAVDGNRVAILKGAGWHVVSMPVYDPDRDFAPRWDEVRGKWSVWKVSEVAVSSAPWAPSTGTGPVPLPAKAVAPWRGGAP